MMGNRVVVATGFNNRKLERQSLAKVSTQSRKRRESRGSGPSRLRLVRNPSPGPLTHKGRVMGWAIDWHYSMGRGR